MLSVRSQAIFWTIPHTEMKTRRLFLILALLLGAAAARADVLADLRSCVGTAHEGLVKRLPIKGVAPFEMVVISDCNLVNTALNPNVSHDHVDVLMSRKVVYVQQEDGSYGLKLVFADAMYNELHLFDRVVLNLNGCRISEDVATGSLTIDGLTPMNVVSVRKGEPLAAKERKIAQLKDSDIYTLVTLKNVEMTFREGAYVNIDERYTQYHPQLHEGVGGQVKGNTDGACCPLRDADGDVIFMAVNALCPWRRNAAPLGSGDVTGVLSWERNLRYGDKAPKMYIRPLDESSLKMSSSRKTAVWKTYIGWFPGRMPGDYFDFEKAGTVKSGVDDRLLNNFGPRAYLWTDSGERRIQKAGSFNSLAFPNGFEPGGCIKFYGTANTWYNWNADESPAEPKSIFVEFSAKKVKASALQFCFEIGAGDGNILNARGVPIRWNVRCSVNDGPWIYLNEADGGENFGLRPLPTDEKYDPKYKRTYHMMYSDGMGMQGHVYNLPAEALGADKVVLRISPCEARWYHLSGDPARDVEHPNATVNLLKKDNKTYSTVRLGTVFIDYKAL